MKNYFLQVKDIKRETEDSVSISFWHPLNEQLKYKAGQFITLSIPDENGKKVKRSYSMSSCPITDVAVTITVKKVLNGYVSNYLNTNIKAGDFIEVMEPMGNFFAEPDSIDSGRSVFLVGAGSGITPLYSIIKTLLKGESNSNIYLLYGNRSAENVIFKKELEDLALNPRFDIKHVYSSEERINGQILDAWIDEHIAEPAKDVCYICGPEGLIDLTQERFEKKGFDKDSIHYERFNSPTIIAEPDEKSVAFEVEVRYDGDTHKFKVEPHQTILEAALELDIDLPYSCQAGMCTACLGKCISGTVKLDEEEGLTDKEIADGYVLTCVARPHSRSNSRNRMTLERICQRSHNNFDLLRILLAVLVVYGHTNSLNGGSAELYDPIGLVLGSYCGSFAVKMFFMLSGLLVANSIISSRSPLKFVFSRFFRIVPGLVIALVLIGVCIGPFLSTMSYVEYFRNIFKPSTTYYSLPGVMENNVGGSSMFGTVWTIRQEVFCYGLLLAIYILLYYFVAFRKTLAIILISVVVGETFFPFNLRPVFGWIGSNFEKTLLPASFALGVLLALVKNRLEINMYVAAAAMLLAFSFKNSQNAHFVMSSCCFILLLYIFSLPSVIKKLTIKYDVSYGIYIYGYFVGQCVYYAFGTINPLLCFLLTIAITYAVAHLSFLWIEKPAMKAGNLLYAKLGLSDKSM